MRRNENGNVRWGNIVRERWGSRKMMKGRWGKVGREEGRGNDTGE